MSLKARRILIVEDDPRISDLIEAIIDDAGGVSLGPFTSVTDAFEQLGELGAINAAVLDIGLIDEDSYALADALKATSIPFVFVTGRDQADVPAR
ncbi:MAG: response regulator, partial [Alphaproteobacteria bacterium]